MNINSSISRLTLITSGNLGIPILLLVILAMMTLPVPPFLLDTLFSFNIALSLVVLLVSVYALRPLDFAVFPTILLVATLLRLALNVASTRVVLLEGHNGGDSAGKVIQSFGEVVVGGNYVVGFIVFLILMIINFVVVTKGAGRISEVSARFTLDALPGKQMAIDADLNTGILNQEEAKIRRKEISSEADFYGSMDGASKFVRGDAIAGILILLINILGGIGIGMLQHDMQFNQAMQVFTLLTIGDGLVAQIPSLLLSTAAAIIVTRVSSESDVREQVISQMFSSPKALIVSAFLIGIIGVIPGMPHTAFLTLSLACALGAFLINKKNNLTSIINQSENNKKDPSEKLPEISELVWDDVSPIDQVGLDVGYKLIPLVNKNESGELLRRIKGVRKKLSQEIGFLIPKVHIRDNLDLPENAYCISILGVKIKTVNVELEKLLAINPGEIFGEIEGISIKDPSFGLDAIWIDESKRDHAQSLGYTVVDISTVIATHINTILLKHIHELIGHEELQQMINQLEKYSPKLVEMLVSDSLPLSLLLKVLKGLLVEKVPLRDFRSIAESIVANSNGNQDVQYLIESVRSTISRTIIQEIYGVSSNLSVFTLDSSIEEILLKSSNSNSPLGVSIDAGLTSKLQKSIDEKAKLQLDKGYPAVLLVLAQLRPILAKFVRFSKYELYVISYNEIPDDKKVTIEFTVQ